MLTSNEYLDSVQELTKLQAQFKKFDEKSLTNKGYPIWVIRSQKEYFVSRIDELQKLIDEFLKHNPNPPKNAKRRRFRNKNNHK